MHMALLKAFHAGSKLLSYGATNVKMRIRLHRDLAKGFLLATGDVFTPKEIERALWSEAALRMKPKKASGTKRKR